MILTRARTRPGGGAALALAAAAAALAGMALVVRQRAERAERDNPPMGRFVRVDGVRLHYVERGEGPPVVLLHGNGSMIQDFALSGVLDRAAERHRVIAFDRPGYGYSERPRDRLWTPFAQARALRAAMARLGVERPIVVGHSWGTLVALAMALEFPADLRGLVLLSGYYHPSLRADVPLLSPPAIPVIGDLMRHTISPLLGKLMAPGIIRKVFAPSPVAPSFAGFPVDLSLRPSQIRASAEDTAFMVPSAAALAPRYGELRLPVAIVAGSGDKVADIDRQSARLHEELDGNSTMRVVPGAGHMIQHIAPATVLAAIGEVAAATG